MAPFRVPHGVLHTPVGLGQTLNPGWDSRGTRGTANPGNLDLTGFQAVPPILNEWDSVGQTLSHLPKTRGTSPKPADLLTMLLVLYWRGGVTQKQAAKLLGIRCGEFVELAELRRAVVVMEAVAWRYFLQAFNECFPECDRRAVYRPERDPRNHGGRTYTDAELLAPPHAGARNEGISVELKVGNRDRPPASNPRVLPRDIGQRPFCEPDRPQTGPEFQFEAA